MSWHVIQEELGGRGAARLTKLEPQYEREWKQTAATTGQLVLIIALGILNVVGVTWLGSLLVRVWVSCHVRMSCTL